MRVKVGVAVGKCPKCGKTLTRPRPATIAVCDCYLYCPQGHQMQPYYSDLTPYTYGPITEEGAYGDLEHPMKILYYCPICKCYSSQQPVEVELR